MIFTDSEEFIPLPTINVPKFDSEKLNFATPDLLETVKSTLILSFIDNERCPAVDFFIFSYFSYPFMSLGETFRFPLIGRIGKFPMFEQPAPFSCVITKPLFGEKKLGVNCTIPKG